MLASRYGCTELSYSIIAKGDILSIASFQSGRFIAERKS